MEEAPLILYGAGLANFHQLGSYITSTSTYDGDEDDAIDEADAKDSEREGHQNASDAIRLPRTLGIEHDIAEEDGVIEEVTCGATFTLALTSKGIPYQWGTINGRIYPMPTRISVGIPLRCIQIACGRKHVLALMEGGFVMSWGVGYFGQLGHGDDQSYDRPRMVHHLDPQRVGDQVVMVACGGLHSAVSTAGQLVFCFGFNRYAQCGQGACSNKLSTPRPVNMNIIGSASIRQLLCGRHHTSILTDKGHVFTFGASSYGRLGLADPKKVVATPTEILFFRGCPAHSLASGDFHCLALGMDWVVYAWGYGQEGQCGLGTTLHLRTPRPVDALQGIAVAQIACGAWWSMAVTLEGHLYCWGYGDGGWLGIKQHPNLPFVEPGPPTERYGQTYSFDSDFNAFLPELVTSLAHIKVERVVGGGGHTVILGRRIQRRLGYVDGRGEMVGQELVAAAEEKGLVEGVTTLTISSEGKGSGKEEEEEGALIVKEGGEEDEDGKIQAKLVKYRSAKELELALPMLGPDLDISAIFRACRHNRLEEVQSAIDGGFHPCTKDDMENTMLHIAATNGLLKMCKVLVRNGGDVNAQNGLGHTPLHLSEAFRFKEVSNFLIDRGADDTLTNAAGLTPYEGLRREDLDAL